MDTTIKQKTRELVEGYAPGRDKPLGEYAAVASLFVAAFGAAMAAAKRSHDLPDRVDLRDVLITGVAVHKLSRLLSKETVTSFLRAPFTRYEGHGGPAEVNERPRGSGFRRTTGEMLLCPFCLGQWVAGGFTAGMLFAPKATRTVASMYTAYAISDFLQFAYAALQKTEE